MTDQMETKKGLNDDSNWGESKGSKTVGIVTDVMKNKWGNDVQLNEELWPMQWREGKDGMKLNCEERW